MKSQDGDHWQVVHYLSLVHEKKLNNAGNTGNVVNGITGNPQPTVGDSQNCLSYSNHLGGSSWFVRLVWRTWSRCTFMVKNLSDSVKEETGPQIGELGEMPNRISRDWSAAKYQPELMCGESIYKPGAEWMENLSDKGIFIGFATRYNYMGRDFHQSRNVKEPPDCQPTAGLLEKGLTDVVLLSSRDGYHWVRDSRRHPLNRYRQAIHHQNPVHQKRQVVALSSQSWLDQYRARVYISDFKTTQGTDRVVRHGVFDFRSDACNNVVDHPIFFQSRPI